MSTFDDASLVFIPSGYKTSKAYSVKPSDGSGDLTFSRSNDTATRVNSAGLIEKVRTNLALQSQNFSSATWLKPASVTYGESDPFGGTNAALVQFDASASSAMAQGNFSITSGVTYTISAWIKGVNLSGLRMVFANNQVIDVFPQVVNGSWVRIKATATATATGTFFAEFARSNNTSAQSFYIYGAQYEVSDFGPTDYIATTSAAVSVGPVANVPRLDYLNSSCPRLLLEPQRTSLVTFSESFDNSGWNKVNGTVTANAAVSPDGYTNADQFNFNASSDSSCYQPLSGSSAAYSISIFAKYVSGGKYLYIFSPTNSESAKVWFDIEAGTVANQVSGFTGAVQDYGNGWYRCTLTNTSNKSLDYMQFGISSTSSNRTLSASSVTYLYGAQVEASAYATSYIPTLGSAVTRGADACRKTGISSLIGQTAGSVFVESYVGAQAATMPFWIRKQSGGLYGDFITVQTINNIPQFEVYTGGVNIVYITGSTPLSVGFHKFAVAYANNDFVFYVDGVQIGTDTSGTPPTCDELYIDQYIDGGIRNVTKKQVMLFKTRLTNAQLAELTTL